MKKFVFVACACIMFLSVILTGCEVEEDEEKDYIEVTVYAKAHVDHYNTTIESFQGSYYGDAYVLIDVTKSGGEGVHEQKKTNYGGYTDAVIASFKVYKEQRIELTATLQGYNPDLDRPWKEASAVGRTGKIISWETILASAGAIGKSCSFDEFLFISMIEP